MDQINKNVLSDPFSDSKLANIKESSATPWTFWLVVTNPDWSNVGWTDMNIAKVGGAVVPTKWSIPVVPSIIMDWAGNQITSFWSPSTIADYKSPVDFTVVYTSASTITLSNLPFSITDDSQIVYIKVVPSSTLSDSIVYVNGSGGYTFRQSSNVITAYKSWATTNIFVTGDVYEVGINNQAKTIDITTDTQKISNQNPTPAYFTQWEWWDGTNLAATTNYYPSALWFSMDNYKHLSISWKMIDADWTMTLTVEGTNDEDQTNADWIQIYWYDDQNKSVSNSWTITNSTLTFAISFNNCNYQYMRVKMVNNWATNTFILKLRQVY